MLIEVLLWPLVGAAIGSHAAPRRGFSTSSGVISGAVWGPFAVLLYRFDWPYLAD